MICRMNLCRNPPRDRPMWVFITHVSAPKIITTCTTSLKKILDTLVLAPSLPSIFYRWYQIFRDFRGFPITAGQSPPEAVKIRPNYFKYDTVSSGLT